MSLDLKTYLLTKFVNKPITTKEIRENIYPDLKRINRSLLEAKIYMTVDQFSTLNTSQVQLIPGTRDGSAIEVLSCSFKFDGVQGLAGNGVISVRPVGGGNQLQSGTINSALIGNGWARLADVSFTGSSPLRIIPGAAIEIYSSADFIPTNAVGDLSFYCLYRLVDPI